MCGITGFIGKGSKETIRAMADSLRHRGPDEEGFFVDEKNAVHLGFRRLSIIDLKTGSQPMTNEDGSVAVVFNGEIYNFKELRDDLARRHTFKTQTDTEVIVHLYEELGERCFEKFNGMFAIAIWDAKKKRLVMARDRMGKKPLYWAKFGDTFLFGSELKALLKHPRCERKLNRAAVLKYFFFLCVPSPSTIFENVYKLEPGQCLVYEVEKRNNPTQPPLNLRGGGEGLRDFAAAGVRLSFYWQPSYEVERGLALPEVLEKLDTLLADATKLRLVSDVPLGIFLSGGIDSSIVAYYAAAASSRQIKTFSIGFNVPTFDESAYAQTVSERIGSEHHVEICEPSTLLDLIPEVGAFLDEPFSDSSVLPTYLLSKFTRQHVTVALGGDGGDELFLGYPTYQAHWLAEWYRKLPHVLQERFLPMLAHLLPVQHAGLSFDYKLKTFVMGAPYPAAIRQQVWISTFHEKHLVNLFTPEFVADLPRDTFHADIDEKLRDMQLRSVDEIAMYLYERYFLGDLVLKKVDRASMASSLEVRAPFLDYRIVEFAHTIPVSLRLKWWQNKYLLKKLMRGKLPNEIMDRPKKGFWAPIGPWLRKELTPLVDQYLSKEAIDRQGIFSYHYVAKLIHEHREGKRDHRKLLWSLLMFQLWHERWMERL